RRGGCRWPGPAATRLFMPAPSSVAWFHERKAATDFCYRTLRRMIIRKLSLSWIACLLLLVAIAPRAQGADAILTPLADAYVRDGTYADQNFGSDPALFVKTEVVDWNRDSYLKFDLSTVSSVGSARL